MSPRERGQSDDEKHRRGAERVQFEQAHVAPQLVVHLSSEWWLVAGGWWLVAGEWWLVAGGWWLVVGGWWLVVGGYCGRELWAEGRQLEIRKPAVKPSASSDSTHRPSPIAHRPSPIALCEPSGITESPERPD